MDHRLGGCECALTVAGLFSASTGVSARLRSSAYKPPLSLICFASSFNHQPGSPKFGAPEIENSSAAARSLIDPHQPAVRFILHYGDMTDATNLIPSRWCKIASKYTTQNYHSFPICQGLQSRNLRKLFRYAGAEGFISSRHAAA
jgi:hypothetical protein